MRKRLKKGFSLAETLMTVLILSIAFASIGGAFMAFRTSYTNIVEKADAQSLAVNIATVMKADFRNNNGNIRFDKDHTLIFYTTIRGTEISYKEGEGSSGNKVIHLVNYIDKIPQPEVPLVSSKMTKDNISTSVKYSWNDIDKYFTATITITDKNGAKLVEYPFDVRPLNTFKTAEND